LEVYDLESYVPFNPLDNYVKGQDYSMSTVVGL